MGIGVSIIYPKPLLLMLKPLIEHGKKNYCKLGPTFKGLILSSDKDVSVHSLSKSDIFKNKKKAFPMIYEFDVLEREG